MGQKDRYSEESYKKITKSKKKYRDEHYVQKTIRVKKEEKKEYEEHISNLNKNGANYSLNSWMNEACRIYAQSSESEG